MKNLNSMIYALNVRCVHVVLNKVAKLDIFLDTFRIKIFLAPTGAQGEGMYVCVCVRPSVRPCDILQLRVLRAS